LETLSQESAIEPPLLSDIASDQPAQLTKDRRGHDAESVGELAELMAASDIQKNISTTFH
jgi:hypothetical protein